jgi:phenylpropionate dioxygenase-like ring-hydroxylating dioxygenase large terminal subunit
MAYLKNAWYVAGFEDDVSPSSPILARRLLDEPVVFFRGSDGALQSLHDRCPHRFVPLSKGRVLKNGTIQCGYHGLCFSGDGKCKSNPHGNGIIPQAARVRQYRVIEKDGLIWWWAGDAAMADESLIPDFSFLQSGFKESTVRGYLPTECSYDYVVDNIMDLTHADFVHEGQLGSGAMTKVKPTVDDLNGRSVRISWWSSGEPAPAFFDMQLREHRQPTDQWVEVTWTAPSVMKLRVGATLVGEARHRGAESEVLHVVTPETSERSHYWYWGTSLTNKYSEAMLEKTAELARFAFEHQDKPMLEAQQKAIGSVDIMSLKPVLLPGDAGAMRARRKLTSLIEVEQNQSR